MKTLAWCLAQLGLTDDGSNIPPPPEVLQAAFRNAEAENHASTVEMNAQAAKGDVSSALISKARALALTKWQDASDAYRVAFPKSLFDNRSLCSFSSLLFQTIISGNFKTGSPGDAKKKKSDSHVHDAVASSRYSDHQFDSQDHHKHNENASKNKRKKHSKSGSNNSSGDELSSSVGHSVPYTTHDDYIDDETGDTLDLDDDGLSDELSDDMCLSDEYDDEEDDAEFKHHHHCAHHHSHHDASHEHAHNPEPTPRTADNTATTTAPTVTISIEDVCIHELFFCFLIRFSFINMSSRSSVNQWFCILVVACGSIAVRLRRRRV
jgi:hypothetical protein